MKRVDLTVPSIVGTLGLSAIMVAPLVLLQWINRRSVNEEFPWVLFTFMLLHASLIVTVLKTALQR